MKVINLLQMNDWPIKKFLIIIFSFQLLFWGSIGLDLIGFRIPILRPLVCFIYLSFLPGFLVLRILKLHKLECIENLLYSVGLSLSILMFIGFFMNIFYPILGFEKPISIFPLTIAISCIILFLCALCYLLDKDFSDSNSFYEKKVLSSRLLFLCLIPILTIIGTYLMNFYNNNFLLMVVVFLISLIIVFVSFDFIPNDLYPLSLFIISFSLLFHNSLISMYVSGWDIQTEHSLVNQIVSSSIWSHTMFSNVNTMLSIVILAPLYSVLCNLNPTWVFKILFPAIFSLMPLGLYLIFKKQTNDKIAFMSVFFFISVFVFYTEMLQLARQQIAEYFFMLIIFLIIKNKHDVSHTILLILFSFSVVVSHYGISYLVMGSIICNLFLLFFYQKILCKSFRNDTINLNFSLLFIAFLLTWYIYISSSSALYSVIHVFENIISNFMSDFLSLSETQGAYIIVKSTATPLHQLAKYMHIFTQICISVGLFLCIFDASLKNLYNFSKTYLSLSVIFYSLLLASIIIPNFSNNLNTSRIYQICLLLLAPFCILGLIFLFNLAINFYQSCIEVHNKMLLNQATAFRNIFIRSRKLFIVNFPGPEVNIKILKKLSLFFMVFLLFNTGWVYEIVHDSPTSFSLNNTMDYPKFNKQDIVGKDWLHKVNTLQYNDGYVYADAYRFILFLWIENGRVHSFPLNPSHLSKNSYLYFSSYNFQNNNILVSNNYYVNWNSFTSSRNQIYDSKAVQIYITD